MAQLSRSALNSFENKKLASAMLLARASMETCAALWYLSEILEREVGTQAIGETDQYFMKLLMGTKIDADVLPKAENVMNFVDHVDKKIAGFRKQYERLSEFAHPTGRERCFCFRNLMRSPASITLAKICAQKKRRSLAVSEP